MKNHMYTYHSSTFGFSIEFPDNWKLRDNQECNTNIADGEIRKLLVGYKNLKAESLGAIIAPSIEIWASTPEQTLLLYNEITSNTDVTELSSKAVTISGLKLQSVTYTSNINCVFYFFRYFFWQVANDMRINIRIIGNTMECLTQINAIIETLKKI